MENKNELKYSDHEKGMLIGEETNIYRLSGKLFVFFLILYLFMAWYSGNDVILPFLKLALVTLVLVVLNLTAIIGIGRLGIIWGLYTGIIGLFWWYFLFDDRFTYFHLSDILCRFSSPEFKNAIVESESYFYYYTLNIIWYCLLLTGSYFGAVSMFFATTNEEISLELGINRDRIYARDSFFVIEQITRYRLFFRVKKIKKIDYSQINTHDFGGGKYLYLNYSDKNGDSNTEIKKYKVRFSRKVDASTRSFLTHKIMKAQNVDKEN